MPDLPRIVIGVTHPQTCLVLTGRLAALRRAGFAVTLVSSPGRLLEETAQAEGVDAVAIPMRREPAPLADLRSLLQLYRFLRSLKPVLTDFSTPKAGLLGNLAAYLARVPHRVYMLRGLKLETSHGLKRRLLLFCEQWAAGLSHTVLANSPSLREEAIRLKIAPPAKIHVLGSGSSNGVDVALFHPSGPNARERLGIPSDAFVLGYVGRLTRDKGIAELFAAFERVLAEVPYAHLLLTGWFDEAEDALDDGLRTRLTTHPQVSVTGFVQHVADYYRAMDVFVMPTYREGFPNAALEAASTAIPIITTRATGAVDAVVDGETGILIPIADVSALVHAVRQLQSNVSLRRSMGQAARSRVEQEFLREQVLDLCVRFFCQQCAK